MKRSAPQSSKFVLSCLAKIALPRGARALDAPCGYGRHTLALRDRGFTVTALDIDPRRVAALSAELSREGSHGERSKAEIADLEQGNAVPARAFDVALVVDYASEAGIFHVLAGVRLGGYVVIETFRAIGGNWQELPAPGHLHSLLAVEFDLLYYDERLTGPTGSEAASVKCLARRRRSESHLGE
jgi:SAM-dependent methyltransferase